MNKKLVNKIKELIKNEDVEGIWVADSTGACFYFFNTQSSRLNFVIEGKAQEQVINDVYTDMAMKRVNNTLHKGVVDYAG
jgi:hypothetical protein